MTDWSWTLKLYQRSDIAALTKLLDQPKNGGSAEIELVSEASDVEYRSATLVVL